MPEFSCDERITLFVNLAAGMLSVTAEPRDTAVVDVQPLDGSSASRTAVENTLVEMRGSALHVESPDRGWRLGRSGRMRFDIRVPEDTRLNVKLASADGRLDGRYGDASINSASGDLSVGHIAGTLSIRTASGDVRVAEVDGAAAADSASGDIAIGSSAADLTADTASGDVTVERAAGSVRVRSASGDVRVGSVRRGTADLVTVSGDVRVGIPAGTSVWLDVATASGKTRSDLDHSGAQPPANGAADLNVRVSTASGDIELRRVPVPVDA
jgi:Toastrack DUF4097